MSSFVSTAITWKTWAEAYSSVCRQLPHQYDTMKNRERAFAGWDRQRSHVSFESTNSHVPRCCHRRPLSLHYLEESSSSKGTPMSSFRIPEYQHMPLQYNATVIQKDQDGVTLACHMQLLGALLKNSDQVTARTLVLLTIQGINVYKSGRIPRE